MATTDELVLQAFLIALSQLDVALPDELRHDIHRIGEQLANRQPGVAGSIQYLVSRHAHLNQVYRTTYQALSTRQQNRPVVQNVVALSPSDSISNTLRWLSVTILSAQNFREAAQNQVAQAKSRSDFRQIFDPEMVTFLDLLQQSATAANTPAIAVLRALERQPLSVEDLSYTLQLSAEQTQSIVQTLLTTGYVAPTSGNLLQKVFPPLWRRAAQQPIQHTSPYFTLTAKGHFHLHPVITRNRRGGAS